MDKKEALLKTFSGQIFHSTIDYIVGLGLDLDAVEETETVSEPVITEVAPIEIPARFMGLNQEVTSVDLEVASREYGLDILFIGEKPADYSGDDGTDLLSKMIGALGLEPEKVSRLLLDRNDESNLSQIQNKLINTSPRAVVTLGAYATNLLTSKKTKLSSIHGQEQKYAYEGYIYSFFPVFHPDYLNINPNMKRTAWNDLKLVLDFLTN